MNDRPVYPFQLWVDTALKQQSLIQVLDPSPDIKVSIISYQESARLNMLYRDQFKPTNVLSFAYEEGDSISGDVFLCEEIIRAEAETQNKSKFAHYAHLVIHGTLHVCGYDHQTEEEAQVMEDLEVKILHQLGFANPYE